MALPALVLVHGGGLAADSWALTVDEIHRREPRLTVVAPDLPGRRDKPADLARLTIADFVDSLVDDIDAAGLNEFVIVGHSIGGMTLPGVVTKLGAARAREMIFAAAFLPPEGTCIADSLPWLLAKVARRFVRRGVPRETPAWVARFAYLNGVPAHRRRFMADKLYPESLALLTKQVSWRGMLQDVPRTWILTNRDRAIAPRLQRKTMAALGGVQKLIEIDTCHCLMVSEPGRLAEILIERCRLHAARPVS